MTEAKHTPGPWVEFDGDICPANDIANVVIATLYQDTSDADARLIAAAPDLLEALEDMLVQADFAASVRGGEGHMKYAMAKARAAIAKAKGE